MSDDLQNAMKVLSTLVGVEWGPVTENVGTGHWSPTGPRDFTMRKTDSRGGLFRVELLEGSVGSIWASNSGTHLHHIGWASHQFHAEIDALERDGWSIEQSMLDPEGLPSVYAYLSRPGEARIEVVDPAAVGRRSRTAQH